MENQLEIPALPSNLELIHMRDPRGGDGYSLVFSKDLGHYEKWIKHVGQSDLLALLLIDLLRGEGTLVDIGANIGTISAPVARTGSKVIAIEMVPENCLRLHHLVLANKFTNMRVIGAAASKYDGMIKYTGSEAWGHVEDAPGNATAVCFKLDTIIYSLELEDFIKSPLAIKIDVEGHEFAVFEGAVGLLAKYRPPVVFESIEIEGRPGGARMCKEFLLKLDYELFLIGNNILAPRNDLTAIQEGHVSDFLAVPKEKVALLQDIQWEIRDLLPTERIEWITSMANFPQRPHRLHAAAIFTRLFKTKSDLLRQFPPSVISNLAAQPEVESLREDLERIVEALR
ncbi:FkbM family methyltransferase [uncultured Rhodoblastus sp.]|uniref:FkbM family methyltransferase n=1 Tax=uncultured Rhodoblastus sp. TaxID=543037 RepID=UPI0025CEBA93|nr:FkbM family methyltransferase [uncultured Rhodoblastus sp.]